MKKQKVTQQDLRERAGIARRTLTGVLSGESDYKVTTLMAVLDRLGYEMAIVPKAAVHALPTEWEPTEPAVKTKVQIAIERLASQKNTS
ncbi:helix-turn-helix domain-containing protein [Herbaspirillum sp. alder98]|uniref:helix-turn-helix domain-containing protein n=1 Tax=Herbaspirillum sp. alder98 TaxID=2913096 RepID=UPI001CD8330F|nr:helix-turn-helix transcriptional regulator [Herbaspirillum sp. alder98]MCA1325790.1 helix-turn-helix transcriptional regulator [Herbaspirillum sp. alder98]